jgi:hypothetical protein
MQKKTQRKIPNNNTAGSANLSYKRKDQGDNTVSNTLGEHTISNSKPTHAASYGCDGKLWKQLNGKMVRVNP